MIFFRPFIALCAFLVALTSSQTAFADEFPDERIFRRLLGDAHRQISEASGKTGGNCARDYFRRIDEILGKIKRWSPFEEIGVAPANARPDQLQRLGDNIVAKGLYGRFLYSGDTTTESGCLVELAGAWRHGGITSGGTLWIRIDFNSCPCPPSDPAMCRDGFLEFQAPVRRHPVSRDFYLAESEIF
ncbi:MAG: hypothetical protein AAFQ67_09600, partial [Pseudomonadota bacterium]